MKILWIIILLTVSQLSFAANEKLILTGSSTIAPLAQEIAKRFEQQHSSIRVDVQSGGSSRGINDARTGIADIGMVSRALKKEENDLTAFSIAHDGIGMIVHAQNKIASLSDQQIKEIYTGKITNWKQIGGNDQLITVVNKAEGRSTLELFLSYFQLDNKDIRAQVIIGDNQQGIKTVAGNPGAIGYVSIGTAEYEAQQGTPIRLLPMQNIAATVENVSNQTFPLSRPLNLVIKNSDNALAQQFINFSQSEKVDDLVKDQFFVPLTQ